MWGVRQSLTGVDGGMPATAVTARKRYLLDPQTEGRTAMRRVCNPTLGLLFLGPVLAAGDALAQTGKDCVGTCTLVSAVTAQGGNKTGTLGSNPKGILRVD